MRRAFWRRLDEVKGDSRVVWELVDETNGSVLGSVRAHQGEDQSVFHRIYDAEGQQIHQPHIPSDVPWDSDSRFYLTRALGLDYDSIPRPDATNPTANLGGDT